MIINYPELFIYVSTIFIGIVLIIGTEMKLKFFINPSGFYPYVYLIKKLFGVSGLKYFNYILGSASIAIGLLYLLRTFIINV